LVNFRFDILTYLLTGYIIYQRNRSWSVRRIAQPRIGALSFVQI